MSSPVTDTPVARITGWRARLPLVALAFIGLTLVALAVSPILMVRRLETLRRETTNTSGIAAPLVSRLRLVTAQEIIEHQQLRSTGDTANRRNYFEARSEENRIIGQVAHLAPLMSPDIVRQVVALTQVSMAWHREPDARAAGAMSEARFVAMLPVVKANRERVLAAQDSLRTAIDQWEVARQVQGGGVMNDQRTMSFVLGLLAFGTLLVLVALGRRERRLTRQLGDAIVALRDRITGEEHLRLQAEQALNMRDQVLRIVSHDLKNPLHTIGMAMALVQEPALDEEERRKQLGVMQRSLRRMHRLVMDLLDVARLESGHAIAVKPEPTPLAALLADARETFEAPAREKHVALVVATEADGVAVRADYDRMQQVLGNLMGNAIKFTPPGGVVQVRAERGEGEARIVVSNTGPGIAERDLERLFEPFWQADDMASQGTGLGLTITKGIVEAHGGHISAASRPGEHTDFVFTVPLA